ncbi:MAG: M23 family metallopeptidase [Oscillospiraceae bacterium]|nr:M23 family metallopeptidase [Oscillospiraceae bacterium]
MVYHEPEKRGIRGLLKNKGFYAIAGLCLVAVGTGVFAAQQTNTDPPLTQPPTQTPTINWQVPNTEDTQVNLPATDVPDERTDEKSTTTKPTESTTQNPNTPFTGEYTLPFGTEILRDFSNGELVYVPTLDDWRSHDGVDFAGAISNEVIAVQAGKVVSVVEDDLWGYVVEIDHGNGLAARYCGLAKDGIIKEGKSVKREDIIGKLGKIPAEAMDTPHLHLEIRVNGKIVDPLEAMNKLGQ